MHPFTVSAELQAHGFWFTYWELRNEHNYSRFESLWLIWVGQSVLRHTEKLHEECGGFVD